MQNIDVRMGRAHLPSKTDLRVYFGNSDYLVTSEGDNHMYLSDEDGDRTRIYNVDIDNLILALQAMKDHL